LSKKYAGIAVIVVGLTSVGIFIGLEITGQINFIDYQP